MMESIKQSISDMTEMFNSKMAEFQKELQDTSAKPHAHSPISKVTADFNTFKSFVMFALSNLQQQVELLCRQCDDLEMKSRRKMLLVHGVEEVKNKNISVSLLKLVSEHLNMKEFSTDAISRCHRFGHPSPSKPRPIIVKFREVAIRDKIWYSKTGFKGTGITASEFLTRSRHNVFVTARQRYGVKNCWTRDGAVIVQGSDGNRHRVITIGDLDSIPSHSPSATSSSANTVKLDAGSRSKRLKHK